jgi:outer membrane protein assembly factor BamE (lipoprotein component of BamABCDE complex)
MNKVIGALKAGAAITLAIALTACAVNLGRSFNEDYAQKIKSGETTKEQVLSGLGRPVLRRVAGGVETWTYAFYDGPGALKHWYSSTTEDEYGIRSQSGRQSRLVVVFKGDVVESSTYTQEIPGRN